MLFVLAMYSLRAMLFHTIFGRCCRCENIQCKDYTSAGAMYHSKHKKQRVCTTFWSFSHLSTSCCAAFKASLQVACRSRKLSVSNHCRRALSGLEAELLGEFKECTGLRGDPLGELKGCTGLRGDPLGGLKGCTGLRGDPLGGLKGCTGLRGDPLGELKGCTAGSAAASLCCWGFCFLPWAGSVAGPDARLAWDLAGSSRMIWFIGELCTAPD